MNKFDQLISQIKENTSPVTNNAQTTVQPASTTTPSNNSTTPTKVDAKNPVVTELVNAKDPNTVLLALKKLGIVTA